MFVLGNGLFPFFVTLRKQEVRVLVFLLSGFLGGIDGIPLLLAQSSPPAPKTLYQVHKENLKSYKDVDLRKLPKGIVTRVVDGDTVVATLEGNIYRVRLIGVDTPESVAPGRPVERFGKEAAAFTRRALEGKVVFLAFDWELFDRYGRLLAYIYLSDGKCFNAELIRSGYAHAYTRYPFQFLEEFRELEKEARKYKRGLWAD